MTAVSAGELGLAEPEETEYDLHRQCPLKAVSACKASGLIAIADDSGLCVDALDGAPGVYTADWAGPDRDWIDAPCGWSRKSCRRRGATTPEQRRANFVCTLCVVWPDGEERFYEGRAHGHLTWPPRGALGPWL